MHARTLGAATAFVLLVATRAHADASSDAKDLFDRARELRAAGDCAGALPLFHKAYEIFPTALGPLRNAAECEESTGRWASARRSWLDLKRAVMTSRDAKYDGWEADASSAAERLAPRVSHLTVDVSTGGSDVGALEVTINGEALPKALVGTTLDRDPGKYVVRARVPGAVPVEQSTDLVTGEARTVRLVLAPAATNVRSPAAPAPPEHRGTSAWTLGGIVTTSLGVAALAGMGVALGVRQSALDTLTAECANYASSPCPTSAKSARDTGVTASAAVTILAVGGAALATAGVVMLIVGATSHERHVALHVSPMGALLEGSF
jgi:hypothetical protein